MKRKLIASTILALLAAPQFAAAGTWNITKTAWSDADERNYSAFVKTLGESGCNSVNRCLQSPANPYRGTDPKGANFWADCGRFPVLLRAYFASKNGLPFSIASGVAAYGESSRALQYSPKGNIVTSRKSIIQKSESQPIDGYAAVTLLTRSVFSAMYRYNAELDQAGGSFYDLYPAKIDRASIRPGTVIYDANGHVAVVYKVENDGRIRFFDSHPDQSVTRSVFGEKFARSNPYSGAGFKNFRPLTLTGATKAANGNYIGGKITATPMSQIPGYSLEYFFGSVPNPNKAWKQAKFVVNGQTLPFYDFVRTRLAVGDLKYDPVNEMLNSMDTLCNDLKERVTAVDAAVSNGIHRKSQPYSLPENIYGTTGEWEDFSSPSRDARLKASFLELFTETKRFIDLHRQGSPRVVYNGSNLIADLRENYERAGAACMIHYRRSDGSQVGLSFHHVSARLWNLSFDPYHCPERRWGATDARELATCGDDGNKQAWYAAEQRLRNQIERTYDAKMNFSLDQLKARAPGSGVDAAPNSDLRRFLYEN